MHRVMIFTEYFLKLQSNPKLSHLPSCHCVPHYNCKVVSREALEKCKCNKLKAMPPAMQIKTSKPQFPFQSHILQMPVPLSAKLHQDRNSDFSSGLDWKNISRIGFYICMKMSNTKCINICTLHLS